MYPIQSVSKSKATLEGNDKTLIPLLKSSSIPLPQSALARQWTVEEINTNYRKLKRFYFPEYLNVGVPFFIQTHTHILHKSNLIVHKSIVLFYM